MPRLVCHENLWQERREEKLRRKRERGKRREKRGKVAHMWTPLPRIVHVSETTLQKS
jgi:hypothetical protein